MWVKTRQSRYLPPAPAEPLRTTLRRRFHAVILKAGYGEVAAQGILDEWFDRYMKDTPAFIKMLEEYEAKATPGSTVDVERVEKTEKKS